MEDHIGKFIGGIVALMVTGFTWLVRIVFTNNKKLAIQEKELQHHRELIERIEKQNDKALIVQEDMLRTLKHIDGKK